MGQECVTCHQGHPSAIGAEDVVREPDKAGERSATGLTADNASICEDCHNWQYEVQGTAPAYKPLASLTSRGGPSHPQRETHHGRVMLDVPAAGEFMPGVKCEECHMPKTNKAANRISHGMKPMLPGEAQTWMTAAGPSYQGEDSCSKCHGGETRSELQANIDTWQDDATAAAAAAGAAIDAANARTSAAALADPTSDAYILVGRATWNYKSFGADGSTGAHNPEYIVAGLKKAEQMAKSVGGSFSAVFGSNSVAPGGTGFITGKVMNGDGSGAAGASLVLYANGSATSATTTADGQGAFAFIITPGRRHDLQGRLAALGRRRQQPCERQHRREHRQDGVEDDGRRLGEDRHVPQVGQADRHGHPGHGRQDRQDPVPPHDGWRLEVAGHRHARRASQYSKTYKPTAKGAWYFRTAFAGTATVASSTSATVKVTVK